MKKEYIVDGFKKYIVAKNNDGLYDYEYQEYSEICNCWYNVSRHKNYTKEAIEYCLEIYINF